MHITDSTTNGKGPGIEEKSYIRRIPLNVITSLALPHPI